MRELKECEFRRDNGTVCGDDGIWVVSVGTRKTDEQVSCMDHLARTCVIMEVAEEKPGVVLHVRELA